MSNKNTGLTLSIIAGLVSYAIIGKGGLYLLQLSWADYAQHSIDRSYTVEMYLSRLLIGILAAMAAGIMAVKAARGQVEIAWMTGTVIFCAGSYVHLFTKVYAEYPIWYHIAYLLPIIPVTGLSGRIYK